MSTHDPVPPAYPLPPRPAEGAPQADWRKYVRALQDELRDASRHVKTWPQHVTLDQMAAMVDLPERGLRRHLGEMPPPDLPEQPGRPAYWQWHKVRPWLMEKFNREWLPECFPDAGANDDLVEELMDARD